MWRHATPGRRFVRDKSKLRRSTLETRWQVSLCQTIERLLDRYGASARICVVKNLGRGKDFSLFEHSATCTKAGTLGAVVIDVPEPQPAAAPP